MVTTEADTRGYAMTYETGAMVRLTRDVQVTGDGSAGRGGLPGPLFLAEGLEGLVTHVAKESGGGASAAVQAALAEFDRTVRGSQFTGFTGHLVDDLRERIVRQGGSGGAGAGAGAGARVTYRVRFVNGFVLDGLDEDCLTRA
ncbi:hypothetical protein AB0M64_17745 [Streptomyces sp. NPDC051771]|uniref:hypothetical protein n=1 Tax=Streptomyces sp. NPDC051771 TaxID=3154847 RepID=UPI00342DB72F